MTAIRHHPALVYGFLVISVLSTAECRRTKAFFELTQRRPIMRYECYRTDVALAPPSSVNLANLMDGTQPKDGNVLGTLWYETRGQPNSYVTETFTAVYNVTSGLIVIRSTAVTAYLEVLLPPYNGAAYYTKLTIVNQRNRVVYKVFDTSGTCVNAAALVFKTCYDIHDECCNRWQSCRGNGVSLSRPRRELGCPLLQYARYPEAEPHPLCADYHSCT